MGDQESKHDKVMKKIQLWVAVLAGVITLSIGVYNAKNIFFSEKGSGRLSLEIRAENGKGVAATAVEIMGAQGAAVASSETDADGNFKRSGLQPGNYTVKILKASFQPEAVVFTIEPGQTTELEIKLKPVASSAIRSAVEEIGASWLKAIASPKPKPAEKTQADPVPAN